MRLLESILSRAKRVLLGVGCAVQERTLIRDSGKKKNNKKKKNAAAKAQANGVAKVPESPEKTVEAEVIEAEVEPEIEDGVATGSVSAGCVGEPLCVV